MRLGWSVHSQLIEFQSDLEHVDRGRLPKLGILAAVQLDGSISFYSVPHPRILRRALGETAGGESRPLFCQ